MPVAQPSSCTFGGPDLDTLFVTSAAEGLELGDGAVDGSVFAIAGLRTQAAGFAFRRRAVRMTIRIVPGRRANHESIDEGQGNNHG